MHLLAAEVVPRLPPRLSVDSDDAMEMNIETSSSAPCCSAPTPLPQHVCRPGVCAFAPLFGNLYVCTATGACRAACHDDGVFGCCVLRFSTVPHAHPRAGCQHVCDRTCRFRGLAPPHLGGGTVCRLSGRFFTFSHESHESGKRQAVDACLEPPSPHRHRLSRC